jgi:hypothetical protein
MPSNRNVLKKYAPQARLDFIQAMINRAAQFGITKSSITQGVVQGDLYILNGKAFPRAVAEQRDRLTLRITRDGFDQAMEAIAYTWFNRFLAIRYMEIHDYFDHGFRVLSHPEGHAEPQVLEQIAKVDLPGLKREEIVSLKIDGTKDEQIYRQVLIAQCNDLHRAMPFLFERIDDETELLLPENLLQSDSIVRKLVTEIDEVEWQEIEIIGWLYQYYISDKKDEVIGKVVKSEDIPAATQLFTPNWIVKYMVQNSLGAQWMATYPNSTLRGEMEYYIAPGEQTSDAQAQLEAITPKELDPESITLIDPAVGSGHILVEAYNLFRTIYLERGYTRKEAARAILTKNLFGLDIDTRAAQMAGFALLMKARADDRSLLQDPPQINVLAIKDSREMDADALTLTLVPDERFEIVPSGDLLPDTLPQPTLATRHSKSKEGPAIRALIALFDGADTFGSLITVPQSILDSLDMIEALLAKPISSDLLRRQAQLDARDRIAPLVNQARLLGEYYDCVVANPPYMGSKAMNPALKRFAQRQYSDGKSDLFAMFIERGFHFIRENGRHAMVTMQSWMFLSNYEALRTRLLREATLNCMAHMGNGVMGIAFGTAATVFRKIRSADSKGAFSWVEWADIENDQPHKWPPSNRRNSSGSAFSGVFRASTSDFEKIPGTPIAYWVSKKFRQAFKGDKLVSRATPIQGIITGNTDKFLRLWPEVSQKHIKYVNKIGQEYYWVPYAKGGEGRKWYGNNDYLLNWGNEGRDLVRSRSTNSQYYFQPCLTWTLVSSSDFAARFCPEGFLWDVAGSIAFPNPPQMIEPLLGFLCSNVCRLMLRSTNPTLNTNIENIENLPIHDPYLEKSIRISSAAVKISKSDWDEFETSWDFHSSPLIYADKEPVTLERSYLNLRSSWDEKTRQMLQLETENNSIFIDAYGLQGELVPDVPLSDITLTCNPQYRYSGDLTETAREERLKSDTMRELISYAVGCIMGRYSLMDPGLIYAHAGGVDFDLAAYGKFAADEDGIIPITEYPWFEDDAATRIEEFLGVAWPASPVMDTLGTLTDGLTMGKGGEPRTALRSYLSKQFFKDHLQTYKNRPIYWLFSSGKHKAFEALVYLHRYNEGLLARMRTEYVTPLMGKLQQRMSDLDTEIESSASSAEKARKNKEKYKLGNQLVELRSFDEELRHCADQRIAIDLDEGVKVNYAKFGNLLSGVDKICGKDKDD